MKNRVPNLFLLLLFGASAFAQNNVLKGRLLGLPGSSPTVFTFGLGFERHFAERFSVQALFFSGGKLAAGSDASSEISMGIYPEARIYQKIDKRRSPFGGLFAGWAKHETSPGGECFPCSSEKSGETVVGFVFGHTLPVGRKSGLEVYAGPRLAFGKTEKTIEAIPPEVPRVERFSYRDGGFRTGFNFFFTF